MGKINFLRILFKCSFDQKRPDVLPENGHSYAPFSWNFKTLSLRTFDVISLLSDCDIIFSGSRHSEAEPLRQRQDKVFLRDPETTFI